MLGKKILIFGASSGIGRETAIMLSEQGAELVMLSRNINKLEEVLAKCKKGNHQIFSVDVTDEEAVATAIAKSVEKDGKPFDGFVFSVGIEATIPSKLIKKQYLENVLQTNSIPTILISRILINKKIFFTNGGSIVFVSSVMGHLGQVAKAAYCMSKHAMVGASKALALEFAPKKIRVNCVSPGMVKTEMSLKIIESISEESIKKIEDLHPLGLGSPKDIAEAIIFLLSDKSRWITGTELVVDGGYSTQ